MVKRLVWITCLLAIVGMCRAQAQGNGFGLGVIVGEPTGISFKVWLGSKTAVDGAVAWSFGRVDALHLHSDFLWHHFQLLKVPKGRLPVYWGIGGRVVFRRESRIGVRVPLGIDYLFATIPLDVFLEVVPMLDLMPSTSLDANGGIGVRFFFG